MHAFDPLNLILLVIAIIVAWRLYSVLGTRTGNERRIDFPLGQPDRKAQAPAPAREAGDDGEEGVRYGLPEEERPVWEGVAEEGSALARTLERMREIDPDFDARHFLEGAKVAYEMIVTAFADGDEATLKPLLAPEIFEQFARVIADRRSRGLKKELEFVGLDEAKLVDARLDGTTARMKVKFVSKVITATRDENGEVVEGNPEKLVTVREIWTFERDLTSSDPNWRLVATEAAR